MFLSNKYVLFNIFNRYYLLNAHYHYIRGQKVRAYSILNKATESSQAYSHHLMLIWVEHTRSVSRNPFLFISNIALKS